MAYWTNKHWGAAIGVALVVGIVLIGVGLTSLAVLFGIGGFYVGKFLDGELDLEEIQDRARARIRAENPPTQPTADQSTYQQDGANVQSPAAGAPRRVR